MCFCGVSSGVDLSGLEAARAFIGSEIMWTTVVVAVAAAASSSCTCSPFSGNFGGCCSGTSHDECSSAFSGHRTCTAKIPVCCSSAFSTVCCAAGSSCTAGCRNSLQGKCDCKAEPTAAAVNFSESEALHTLGYNAASQCNADAIANWSCAACPSKSRLLEINVTEADGHLAYVGYDAELHNIQVVLRGSLSIKDWLDNLDFVKESAYESLGCTGCKVHRGFRSAFKALQPGVEASVEALLRPYPQAAIAITGHSLGGAMAVHAAISLHLVKRLPVVPTIYTFGQPRVGDEAFGAWFAHSFANRSATPPREWFRVVHWNDPVPHLPPASLGFEHAGREIWYDESSAARVICDDGSQGEDPDCSDSAEVALVISDHFSYLGHKVVQCAPFGNGTRP